MAALGTLIAFIPTRDGDAARAFYETKVGLRFISDDQFALVFQSGDNMIRISRGGSFTPAPFTILGWQSSQIEQDVRDMSARGITFERYDYMTVAGRSRHLDLAYRRQGRLVQRPRRQHAVYLATRLKQNPEVHSWGALRETGRTPMVDPL